MLLEHFRLMLMNFRVVDFSGKLPNGLLAGSINTLGEYDACIDLNVQNVFRGQYCLLDVGFPVPHRRRFVSSDNQLPELNNISGSDSALTDFLHMAPHFYHLKLRTSLCLPSSCSRQEVEMITSKMAQMIGLEFNITVPNCETSDRNFTFVTSELVIMCVLGFLVILGIISTATDVVLKLKANEDLYQKDIGVLSRCLLSFSFYTNTQRLLKKDDSPDTIKIFHGMKVITLLWVILNHTYYYLNLQVGTSLLNAREIGKEHAFQFIANGFLNVETFFFISSVLVAYGVMKMKENRVNVLLYIFRRLWRLTPPFMFVISCVYVLPYISHGPVWKETITDGLTAKCRNNWWKNMLYINNFIPSAEACLHWAWYIPVDTHLYFLSLLVLIPLKRNPRLAFMINGCIFVIGIVMSATFNVYYGLHPTAIYVYNHPDDINYFVDHGYFRSYLHVSTYCVGLTVGYILATHQKLRIPMKLNVFAWIASFVLALSVLYGVYDWNQGNVPGIVTSTLYTCTNKLVWSAALAWVTIACMSGNGGFVTQFLSWNVFVPFGRLTYMAYLIHPIIHIVYIGSTRTLIRTAHRTLVYIYIGNVVLAFMFAYVMSLLFESPFMALEKVMLSSKRPMPDANDSKDTKQGDRDLPSHAIRKFAASNC